MSGTSAPADDADLALCHEEPIRVPGSIQPHGVLLALEGESGGENGNELVVTRASANLAERLGTAVEDAIGVPLGRVLGAAFAAAVRVAEDALEAEREEQPGHDPRHAFAPELVADGVPCRCDALLHRTPTGTLVLELDGFRAADAPSTPVSLDALQRLTRRLHAADDVRTLSDAIVHEVRALTGFDRVMAYRFHADEHGEVIAESVVDGWPPYLGLHYPESDIPAQARELYRRSPIRVIPAVPYAPAPILPNDAAPLDLSLSHLRSVSPVHVEYLVNMGVGASMSISLLDGERLWGLIACHHREARPVDASARALCELLGSTFSLLLPRMEAAAAARRAVRLRDVEERLHARLRGRVPFVDGGVDVLPALRELVDADGVASIAGTTTRAAGLAPEPVQIEAFAAWLEREVAEEVFASDRIATRHPGASDWPHALAGTLVIEISRARRQYLMAFRTERERHVRWAGRPDDKPIVARADGGRRLSPRRSFAEWRESVRGTSAAWGDVALRSADALRRAMLQSIVDTSGELLQLNRELERSRERLQEFAHIAAHDLREPLRGVHNYTAFLLEDHGASLDADARALIGTIRRLADRGDALTAALLEFAEADGVEPARERFALAGVVEAVRETFAPELARRGIEFRVREPLPALIGDPIRLEQILANLVGNAIKYTRTGAPWIEISATPAPAGGDPSLGDGIDDSGGGGADDGAARLARLDRRSHVVAVADDGIGIPAEHHADVFRLFRRLHRREGPDDGVGIGLTIVKRLVEQHGGHVHLESEPGAGSTFRFTYGLIDEATAP